MCGLFQRSVSGPAAYAGLAAEYKQLLGPLAEQTWRGGVLADVRRLGLPAGVTVVDLGAGTGIGDRLVPVARHSSWRRRDTPLNRNRNRNSLTSGDTSVNIVASDRPREQQLSSSPGRH
jgi:hypothetical protein